jgi:large conductance mechanosensitive channel
MQRYLSEFRRFAGQGSVFTLAVAVAIGIAFGKIVESVVNDVVVPLVAGLFGKADFTGLFIPLANPPAVPPTLEALKRVGVPIVAYGNLLATILNFVFLAVAILLVARYLNGREQRDGQPRAEAGALPAASREQQR